MIFLKSNSRLEREIIMSWENSYAKDTSHFSETVHIHRILFTYRVGRICDIKII